MNDPVPSPPGLKHELRTPLNHVIGYCEMLIEEAGDHELAGCLPDLERIHAAGRRLLAVINELFEPHRAPAFRSDPVMFDHEIRTPLNQIIGYAELLQEEARERGLDRVANDLEKICASARGLLEKIVSHFGSTREQFMASAGAMPEDGTAFFRRESGRLTEVIRAGRDVPSTHTGVILVVDDDEPNRDMLARRLERLGHQLALAASGREALERLRERPFDLVLLDLQMPDLSGDDVLAQMKADPAWRDLPVIVLSASDDAGRVARCILLGAEDHLSKPFDPVLLQARIQACLERKRLRDREVLHLQRIQEEKRRSDELLHIILPREVAAEIKATKMVRPRRFEDVAVLFCDIVGFTAWCERHSPEDVLLHLQGAVQAFEKLTADHGLEKIKTIGDAFMATAGMLVAQPYPARAAARCGLAMIAAARKLPPHWEVRVGLHAGPVIAGVVGREKYQYDVWGDTVNTAMRMAQMAPPGSVMVNATTWQLLAGDVPGRSHGRHAIKGKGELELFVVESVRRDEA